MYDLPLYDLPHLPLSMEPNMNHSPRRTLSSALRLTAALCALSLLALTLSACGGTPKQMDADGLRERAQQSLDEVK